MIWVESECPSVVGDIILPERIKKVFQDMVDSKELSNMILTGPSGCGKTTVAKIICKQMGYDYLMLNGSGQLNVDTLRTDVTSFAQTVSLTGSPMKVVIIDEIDGRSSQQVQEELRGFIEAYSHSCRFILTCNNINRITDPIQSRCPPIAFDFSPEEIDEMSVQMYHRLESILQQRSVEIDPESLLMLINTEAPDWRKIINTVQKYSRCGKIDSGVLVSMDLDEYHELIEVLRAGKFNAIKEWVDTHGHIDPMEVISRMYREMGKVIQKESMPELILILDDHQDRSSRSVDQRITLMATMINIVKGVQFNG